MTTNKAPKKIFYFEPPAKKLVVERMEKNPVARAIGTKFLKKYGFTPDSYQALSRVFTRVALPKIVDQDLDLLLDHEGDSMRAVNEEVNALSQITALKKNHVERDLVSCFVEVKRLEVSDETYLKHQHAVALVARLHRLADAYNSITLISSPVRRHLCLV